MEQEQRVSLKIIHIKEYNFHHGRLCNPKSELPIYERDNARQIQSGVFISQRSILQSTSLAVRWLHATMAVNRQTVPTFPFTIFEEIVKVYVV